MAMGSYPMSSRSLSLLRFSTLTENPLEPTTATLAGKLFGETGYIMTVEIAAVLLLAAILGAIVLVREK